MTLELLMDLIWQGIGEPTDLDPDTDTQYGGDPLLKFICNEAQRRIATWKDPATNHMIQFRALMGELYFRTVTYSDTLDDAATDASNVILPSADVLDGDSTYDDAYNGWVLEIDNEARVIIDYNGTARSALVHEAFSSTPASGDSYKLYKNFFYLLPSTHAWVSEHITLPSTTDRYRSTGNLQEILKIVDLPNERTLSKARGSYYPSMSLDSPGDAGQWWRYGNKLLFDRPEDTNGHSYYMEYYRLPTEMAGAGAEPEIPEMFHWGIVLWGINWGFARQQDMQAKWSGGQDFLSFMRSTVTEYEMSTYRGEHYGSLQRE